MIIADTGFWLALANRKDKHHRLAARFLDSLGEPLITTWPVMAETCHLLLHRVGLSAQQRFMENYASGNFSVFDLSIEYAPKLNQLMAQYANLPMDLADASLVILAEHLGEGRIVSTDKRDFMAYRWKRHKPFVNLLIE